jgi:hypothetical protein
LNSHRFHPIAALLLMACVVLIMNCDTPYDTGGGDTSRMSYAQKVQKFRKTRNLWMADPGISDSSRKEMLGRLSGELFPDGNVPRESEADRKEQDRMRVLIMELKSGAASLKNNPNLTEEQKKEKLKELFLDFVRKADAE